MELEKFASVETGKREVFICFTRDAGGCCDVQASCIGTIICVRAGL